MTRSGKKSLLIAIHRSTSNERLAFDVKIRSQQLFRLIMFKPQGDRLQKAEKASQSITGRYFHASHGDDKLEENLSGEISEWPEQTTSDCGGESLEAAVDGMCLLVIS